MLLAVSAKPNAAHVDIKNGGASIGAVQRTEPTHGAHGEAHWEKMTGKTGASIEAKLPGKQGKSIMGADKKRGRFRVRIFMPAKVRVWEALRDGDKRATPYGSSKWLPKSICSLSRRPSTPPAMEPKQASMVRIKDHESGHPVSRRLMFEKLVVEDGDASTSTDGQEDAWSEEEEQEDAWSEGAEVHLAALQDLAMEDPDAYQDRDPMLIGAGDSESRDHRVASPIVAEATRRTIMLPDGERQRVIGCRTVDDALVQLESLRIDGDYLTDGRHGSKLDGCELLSSIDNQLCLRVRGRGGAPEGGSDKTRATESDQSRWTENTECLTDGHEGETGGDEGSEAEGSEAEGSEACL